MFYIYFKNYIDKSDYLCYTFIEVNIPFNFKNIKQGEEKC